MVIAVNTNSKAKKMSNRFFYSYSINEHIAYRYNAMVERTHQHVHCTVERLSHAETATKAIIFGNACLLFTFIM